MALDKKFHNKIRFLNTQKKNDDVRHTATGNDKMVIAIHTQTEATINNILLKKIINEKQTKEKKCVIDSMNN